MDLRFRFRCLGLGWVLAGSLALPACSSLQPVVSTGGGLAATTPDGRVPAAASQEAAGSAIPPGPAAPANSGSAGLPSPFPTWTVWPGSLGAMIIPTWTPSPTPPATPTVPATVVPTFTPPPQPADQTDDGEHYWFDRPIPAGYTTWTDRIYPFGSTRGGLYPTHHGVEFFNPVGVPVLAAGAGEVVTAGADDQVLFGPQADFYGMLVVIRHDQLYRDQYVYTLYGHLSQVWVEEGQRIEAGETVGLVGGTGVANGGAHLHFEVRVGQNSYGATRNPELWLRPFPNRGVIAGQLLWPDGSYVVGAPLVVQRADDPSLFVNRTLYTYADSSVNPDDEWGENFSTPDVESGPYVVIFSDPDWGVQRREMVWVYPGQTALVTIQLPAVPTPTPTPTP